MKTGELKPQPHKLRALTFSGAMFAVTMLMASTASAQDWSVDWHTIDGGGELLSETADQQWQVSGTIGQADATESIALAGGGWTVTGGFWPVTVDQTDVVFRDGFEGE